MKGFLWGGVAGISMTVAVTVTVLFTFGPKFLLGYVGMPRRYHLDPVQAPVSSAPLTQTGRTPQFENAAVKAWKTVVAPGMPTSMHRHDHPRVIVALTDGTMAFVGSDGRREEAQWDAGRAYWLPAMPAGAMHQDVNAGTKPLEVIVVELEKE